MNTAKEIVDDCNELARAFYQMQGYRVPEGYKFHKATHPQEVRCWDMATFAYDFIAATEIEDLLSQLDEEGE